MKRQLAIQLVLVLSVLAMMFAFPSQEAAGESPKNIKLQTTWVSGSTLFASTKLFAERVEKMSGGELKFDVMAAGAIVPPLEVLDAIGKGVVDAGHSVAAYWSGKDKAAALFSGAPGGPFGFDLLDYWGWLYNGGGLELYRELYQDVLKKNVIPIPMTMCGPQIFGWFERPIKNWADVKGRKCRMGGLTGDVYVGAGMKSVSLPAGEILPAAERGIIECSELVGFAEDTRLGLHQVFKYVYSPGVHEPNCTCELLFNGDFWKKLTPEHQEIIKSAATEVSLLSHIQGIELNALAIKDLKEKQGVHVETTPNDIHIKVLESWDKIMKEEAARNPVFKKILDSQRAYAQLVVPAHRQYMPDYSFVADYYWPAKGEKEK
jgi:TRAP-type mannitol/chloroaromatic compound transport system substrate-binding protein